MTDEEPRPTLPTHLICICIPAFQPSAKHGTEPRPKPASHRRSAAAPHPARASTLVDATSPQPSRRWIENQGVCMHICAPAPRRHHTGTTPAPRQTDRQKVGDKGEIRTRAPLLRPGNPGGFANSGVPEPGALDRSATLPFVVEWCLAPGMWRYQPPPPSTDHLCPKRNLGTFPHSAPEQRVGVHSRQFIYQSRTRGAFRRLHRAAHGLSHAAQMKRPATRDSDQKIYGVLVREEIRLVVEKGKGARINNCRSNCSVAPHTCLRFHRSIPSQEPSG